MSSSFAAISLKPRVLSAPPVMRPAMDPSQHAFHHHLARALMHLNQLASFLPSFEFPAEWDSTPGAPRPFPHHQPFQLSRQLHRFVPLPTDTRPPPSLASHGDLPSHFVMNPEPHFHPVIHRETHPTARNLNCETIYEDVHMVEDISRPYEDDRPAPPAKQAAKQASRSTAPRSVTFPEDPPPVRSSKRPRTTSMVEHVNKFGSPTREGASSSIHPSHPAPTDPSGHPPPSARHTSVELDSDEQEPDRERAPSPAPTVPGYIPSNRHNATESTPSAPNPLDPAIADHRNRPWPPADDRTLIRFKMDTKSRPSWKTIASRLNRTADSCQARWQWQWLKNTNSPLLHPETLDEHQAADD